MILIDEEGTKMQASVFKSYFAKFEEHLRENECYFIFRPTLADNDAKIKHVENGQKISFRWQTDLKKCTNFQGSKYGFEFTGFRSILENPLPQYTRLDIIGYVYKCYEVEKKPVRGGKVAMKMEIKLEDLEGGHIIVTLWEEYCLQMLNYMEKKQQPHVFLILQFGNLQIYGKKRTVSNVYDATRLFINSPIDEILEFKKSFLSNIGEETSSHHSVGTSIVSSLEEEFLNEIDFINIVKLMK
ncbi:replication protein A 70 kDa DNA-binding subunit A-like [Bidens hawaiensis]|uniref:replication protein A 70 kDa DNA-binding subunit A-like n=1 Tax=Bidens hawaiensis TaxID=980011 RepID=UPI00404B8D73